MRTMGIIENSALTTIEGGEITTNLQRHADAARGAYATNTACAAERNRKPA